MASPDPGAPVRFQNWTTALRAAGLSSDDQRRFREEIGRFLGACRECVTPATVNFARSYLADLPAAEGETARAALRWWFRSAPSAGMDLAPISADQPAVQAGSRPVTPLPAASDLGGPAW